MKVLSSLFVLASMLLALPASADTAFEAAFRTSLLKSFDEASGKIIQLAEAIPEDKYGWQPMTGVNTVREVLVHVTETNLALGGMLGAAPLAGVDRKTVGESMQTKAGAIALTKQAMAHMHGILATIPADQLTVEITVFGAKAPRLRAAMLPVDHAHEHLGQLIAYARSNHVTPPWSK